MTDTKHSAEREVKITVSGSVGCGKSALLGEIEIMCKALGVPVRYADESAARAEKNMTHAEWTADLEMYKPSVVLVEHIDRAGLHPTASTQVLDTPEKQAANALLFDMIGKPKWDLNCAAEHLKKFADAAIAAAAPKAALTDAQIAEYGKNMPAFQAKEFRDKNDSGITVSELNAYEAQIAFARAIEAASGPNAALVEALKEVSQCLAWLHQGQCRGFSEKLLPHNEALELARSALAAAGVKP